jgi:phage gpG-like protein
VRVVLDINGLRLAENDIDMVDEFLQHDEEAMKEIMEIGRLSTVDNFLEGGRPRWESPAKETLRHRRDLGFGEDPLRVTEETMESFLDSGNAFTIAETGDHYARWGNSRPDFILHDQGSSHEPERRILIHQPDDEEAFKAAYVNHLLQTLASGGE